MVRMIAPGGVVTTLAGTGSAACSTCGSPDGVGRAASFFSVGPLAVDPSGNVYVGDHSAIRMITPTGERCDDRRWR